MQRVIDNYLGAEANDRIYMNGKMVKAEFMRAGSVPSQMPRYPEPPMGTTPERLLSSLELPAGADKARDAYVRDFGAEKYNEAVSARLLDLARKNEAALFTSSAWKSHVWPAQPRSASEAKLMQAYQTWLSKVLRESMSVQ
ncbi:MAG: hypothetical protein JST16_01505 [Bdellovibrionales bacterium]|nr:hypothetical protein [Bdellovibrionales bacterium]